MDEETLFHETAQRPAGERAAFLARACGHDAALRRRVEALLDALDNPATFLELPAAPPPAALPTPGTLIGRYKLLEPLGEGGYGTVFMAEQTSPVHRKVALKIIKPGMDTRQVIARFEAERQALALMDHPNIARVFDAGVTDAGRPYFVMELVKGVSIIQYCDQHRLPPRARLELFVQVCLAVQHAHTKGIIHRDLKPSNVLVALYDGKPVPKVIDFGVAKATGQSLTDRTLFTGFGDVIGTLEYMSPEQAQLNQLDVDTRSDIYSLGVLLYELLTGSTPLEKDRIKQTALLEALRFIREEEPPKPSTRLSTTERLPDIAARRGLEPKKLSGVVTGELDWIVMRALEKDRARRYETANGLLADVQRYLTGEAVQACPPSASYRFSKFAKRNKVAFAVAALVLTFLVLLGSVVGWTLRDRTARQAKMSGQLEQILDDVVRLERAEKWSEALISVRRAEPGLAAGEAPTNVQNRVRQIWADLELVERLDDIRARSGAVWVSQAAAARRADKEYAAALSGAGIDLNALSAADAARLLNARHEIASALVPALDDWLAVRAMVNNGEVRSIETQDSLIRRLIDVLHAVDPDAWRQRVREAIVRKDQATLAELVTSGDLDSQPAATLTLLYSALWASGKTREQELILRRAQWKHPADFWINHRLGVDLIWQRSPDRVRDGIGYMRAAVALHPRSAHAIMNLGNGFMSLGQFDEAIACYRKESELAPNEPGSSGLGEPLARTGHYDEAIAAFERAMSPTPMRWDADLYAHLSMIHSTRPDVQRRDIPRAVVLAEQALAFEPNASNYWTALGIARYRQNKWTDARNAFEKSLQLRTPTSAGDFRWADATDWFFLAMSNWQLGQNDEARHCYDRAVQWIGKAQPWEMDVEELARFRAETEHLLKITTPQPTTTPAPAVKKLDETG